MRRAAGLSAQIVHFLATVGQPVAGMAKADSIHAGSMTRTGRIQTVDLFTVITFRAGETKISVLSNSLVVWFICSFSNVNF